MSGQCGFCVRGARELLALSASPPGGGGTHPAPRGVAAGFVSCHRPRGPPISAVPCTNTPSRKAQGPLGGALELDAGWPGRGHSPQDSWHVGAPGCRCKGCGTPVSWGQCGPCVCRQGASKARGGQAEAAAGPWSATLVGILAVYISVRSCARCPAPALQDSRPGAAAGLSRPRPGLRPLCGVCVPADSGSFWVQDVLECSLFLMF